MRPPLDDSIQALERDGVVYAYRVELRGPPVEASLEFGVSEYGSALSALLAARTARDQLIKPRRGTGALPMRPAPPELAARFRPQWLSAGVYRNYDESAQGCWLKIERKKLRFRRYFPDWEWGGPEGAQREAERVRDAMHDRFGVRPRGSQVGPHVGGKVRAKSGVQGVGSTQQGAWIAKYYFPRGKLNQIYGGYGPEGFARACRIRSEAEAMIRKSVAGEDVSADSVRIAAMGLGLHTPRRKRRCR